MRHRNPAQDIAGQRFASLVVVARAENNADGRATWLCRCDCGNETTVLGKSLRSGMTRSCGCLRAAVARKNKERNTKHGGSKSRTYASWSAMRERCLNPAVKEYPRYGGRGITICESWSDFANFLADMGERPAGKTLDRRDTQGNYTPDNCRWATPMEQGRNRTTNRVIEHKGESRCLAEWAQITGMGFGTLKGRLDLGWPIEKALSTPVRLPKAQAELFS